jgi:short subunit dehydrogenase-like uncharacterized protein
MSATKPPQVLLYGASGYTGALIAQRAAARGLRPILGGRSAPRLAGLAGQLGLSWRTAGPGEPERLADMLGDVRVVLNAAGPFSVTARPLLDACLATGTHYLDVTGEIPVFDAIHRRGREAIARGVMLMPGVGFVVVPSDCLAAHVAAQLPGAERLTIALSGATRASRGSAKTAIELWSDVVRVRHRRIVVPVPTGSLERWFDYGQGPRLATAVSWGDVFTAFHTTRVPNVEVYHEVSPAQRGLFRASRHFGPLFAMRAWKRLLAEQADLLLPPGPPERHRRMERRVIVAEAEDRSGRRVAARVHTPEAYACTAVTAVAVVERVLGGDLAVGYQTPARVYGAGFVRALEGVVLEDLPTQPAHQRSVARS